jgi:hypothetical protein
VDELTPHDWEPAPAASVTVLPNVGAVGGGSRRWWVPAVAAAAVVALLGGGFVALRGGSSAGSASSMDLAAFVHDAPARTAQQRTSQFTLQLQMTMFGHTINGDGGGEVDYRHQLAEINFNFGGVGRVIEVITPTALYMRMPSGMSFSSSKPWVSFPLRLSGRAGNRIAKQLSSSRGADPSATLRLLSSVTNVRNAGTTTIDGVKTTHVSATSPLASFLHAEGMQSLADQAPAMFRSGTVTVDAWLDSRGVARRVTMSMTMGTQMHMQMTMNMADFGAPVTIVVPPKALVTDLGAALGGA